MLRVKKKRKVDVPQRSNSQAGSKQLSYATIISATVKPEVTGAFQNALLPVNSFRGAHLSFVQSKSRTSDMQVSRRRRLCILLQVQLLACGKY